MKEIRAAARERMKGHCRVCPVCDGKACSGEVPGMGGLGTGASFRNNREALNACKLNMTALHDAREPRTNCTILGIDLSFPVMAAPIGGVSFNMSDAMSEDDYIFAILEGSRAAGVIGCTGDGVPPFIIDAAVKALKACNGHGIPFIKPWEGKELFEKIDRVLADGAVRDGVDVLKMLALGADAVLVGRPLCIAAIGGGVEGVTKYWQQMQGQLVQAMLLTGCASLADVREHIIYRG